MTEEPLSRGIPSPSDSNMAGDMHPSIVSSLDERLLNISAHNSLNVLRMPATKKAKRIRFFRNGDKFYTGVVMAVTQERYRSFDSLASDLTRALVTSVTLPNGVRSIYSMDGRKIQNISDLEDGKCYVVSGQGESFKKVEYSASKVRRGSSLSGLPQSPAGTGRLSVIPGCVKARIITLIRHGTKPRKVVRLLLNKRNAPSLEHAFEAITEAVKLDSGAVRKVFSLSGQQVTSLDQFFDDEEIFIAYGTEKSSQDDFELDFEESKCVQSYRRGPWVSKRQSGPMPKMPKKSGKKSITVTEDKTPTNRATPKLPMPLRLNYAVGRVIGDGNFAVVRHCVHRTTGEDFAIKIVDKTKCSGKETMLASEVAILRQVCHPNIIRLITEQETTDQLFLVMELVEGGDLFDAIAAATKFSEAEASVMIGHLVSALAYLHNNHIVHRDVKPENLLVEMDGNHVRCLKLGDFGLAQIVKEPLYTVCGTPTYVAPEILAETGYGLKIDVWAAGVILYILLCGFPPFLSVDNEQEELFDRILSAQYEFTSPYWDNISDSAKQLISNMLQAQPELRFSAEDVLDHPWLSSFLGGEQTSQQPAVQPPQQHGDQQCQPIRMATYEFDSKQRRVYDSLAYRSPIPYKNNSESTLRPKDEVDFFDWHDEKVDDCPEKKLIDEDKLPSEKQNGIKDNNFSSDCLSGSSNDIETSDSFVNIQFVRIRRQKSSSTHSLESSESFENIRFYCDNLESTKSSKSVVNNRQLQNGKSKIPVHQSPKSNYNENVQLRDKRSKVAYNDQRKRLSCGNQYSAPKRDLQKGPRKFNSSDELREENQKQNKDKSKRFSLYYTPQPLRKMYENDKGKKETQKKREVIDGVSPGPSRKTNKRNSQYKGQVLQQNGASTTRSKMKERPL